MFRPLSQVPIHQLTDRVRLLTAELGGAELGRIVRSQTSTKSKADSVESALRMALPAASTRARLARDLVERVRADPGLRSVAVLAELAGLPERALQRLFRDYVGVSPKWVVCRFRLQEAAELLATTSETIASLAARLGYFDQAHFTRDFKSVVGEAPLEFVAKQRARSGP